MSEADDRGRGSPRGKVAAAGEGAKHRENTKITGRNQAKGKEGGRPSSPPQGGRKTSQGGGSSKPRV